MADTAVLTEPLSVAAAAERRRSIRAYSPEPIPHDDLEAIFDVVRRAPSAFNAQPWRFVVVESPAMKDRLVAAANNQRQVRSAPATIVLYTDMADTLAELESTQHPGMDPERRAGQAGGIRRSFGAQSEAEREAWAYAQGHIALGYLVLAAESLGYQTSPMAGFDPEAVKQLLGLPAHVRVPALVAIGRGTEERLSHHRHAHDRVVRYV
ncbi:NADH dehydrogenase [Gemmatimonadetes bacterium T265]|nr:NADH dehydrogenase [Gemmatimonadetes bacterium T265]